MVHIYDLSAGTAASIVLFLLPFFVSAFDDVFPPPVDSLGLLAHRAFRLLYADFAYPPPFPFPFRVGPNNSNRPATMSYHITAGSELPCTKQSVRDIAIPILSELRFCLRVLFSFLQHTYFLVHTPELLEPVLSVTQLQDQMVAMSSSENTRLNARKTRKSLRMYFSLSLLRSSSTRRRFTLSDLLGAFILIAHRVYVHSVRNEATKLILVGTRVTYQATGDAGTTKRIRTATDHHDTLATGARTNDVQEYIRTPL